MGAAAGLERHSVPSPSTAWALPGKVRRQCDEGRVCTQEVRSMRVAVLCLFPVVFGLC